MNRQPLVAERVRRVRQREYLSSDARELFDLQPEEMFYDVKYDRERNRIIVVTFLDHDKKQGDI